MSNLQRNLIVFGRLLRGAGIDVHVGRMIDVTGALQHVDLASRGEVYHTCRALLVHRHDQLAVFDRAFEVFWRQHVGRSTSVKGEAGAGDDRGRGDQPGEWIPIGDSDPAGESVSEPQTLQT